MGHESTDIVEMTEQISKLAINWWLLRGTLLMESGLLRDFLGNFSMRCE